MMRLILIVLIVDVLCSTQIARADATESNRERAISSLRNAGVKVDRSKAIADQPATRIFFGCHRAPGSLVRELQYVPEVQVLNLRLKDDVSDNDLKGLAQLVNLNELVIHHCPIRDRSLAYLKEMKKLRKLQFASTEISDKGLRHLAGLTSLQQLQLTGNGITDEGMKYLEKLNGLKELRLSKTSVTEDGVQRLQAKLPETKIMRR